MKRSLLWAPWRIEYILSKKKKECIFCTKPYEKSLFENLILFKGKLSFVIMNKFPYNSGHLMVVPYKHTHSIEKLEENELLEINKLLTYLS